MTCALDARWLAGKQLTCWLLLCVAIATIDGCAQHGQLLAGPLHVSDEIGPPQPEGTLILMELVTPLTRDQTLARFRAADLQLVGLTEADVRDGTAVFGTPWRQPLYALIGAFILAKPDLSSQLNSGRNSYGGFGGDAVAVRVAKAGTSQTTTVYVVDSIVEARTAKGDCYYIDLTRRPSLYCKSLEAKGWAAHDGMFVKRPDSK